MNCNRIRQSNFELMRIISMFFIVLWHVILNGNLLSNTVDVTNFTFYLIMFIIVFHVNSFLLLTGYFQVDSKFKLSKLISLLFQLVFYNLIINITLYKFGLVEYTNVEFIKSILFYNASSYWFISCYIILYCLSPFLNKLIHSLDKLEFKKNIIVLLLFFSVLPIVTNKLFLYHNGLGIIQFIIMYFLGAYIKKTEIDKRLFKNFNIIQKRILLLIMFSLCVIFNLSLFYLQKQMNGLNSNILVDISSGINLFLFNYSNPIIIIQSIAVFVFFSTLNIKNRLINYISSLTLGVYLLHDNYNLRVNLFKWIGIDKESIIYGKRIILYTLFCAFIIFILGLIVESIRNTIVKLLRKNIFIKKVDNKMILFIEKIININ